MTPIEGQPILTAAQMRAAEDRAIADGASVESLMDRAGAGVAEAVRRLAALRPGRGPQALWWVQPVARSSVRRWTGMAMPLNASNAV